MGEFDDMKKKLAQRASSRAKPRVATKYVGLGHYSRTGKDTLANAMVDALERRGLVAMKLPFAWKLKQIAYELYAWMGLREPEFYETDEGAKLRDVKLQPINKTPVEIWIDFGTPAVREQVYESTWVDYVMKSDHNCDVLIIPDTRFRNEVEAIREAGGKHYKILRPGYKPRPTSVADNALIDYDGWDRVISAATTAELGNWAEFLVHHDILQN